MPLIQKIHLRAKSRPGLFIVKIRQKGIVVGIENAPRVQLLGQHFRESRFPHANRPFDHNVTRRFECRFTHGARL